MVVVKKKAGDAPAGSKAVLDALKKHYGEPIGSMGDSYGPPDRLATGIFPLDLACGGGFPYNRITLLYGPESCGKTLVGYKALAACQRIMKKRAVLIDREDVYDRSWAAVQGVDVDDLIVIKPSNAEQVVDAVEGFLNAEDVGLVLLDSIAMSQPQKWIDAEAGTAMVGGNTQILSSLYTKAGAAITHRGWANNPVLFVVINQIRYKIGVMYGDPETMPGGVQPKFTASLILRFYGKKVTAKEVSNRMPSHLHVEGVIKKWRVPIFATSFEYDMALVPQGKFIKPGDVLDTWKTVGHYMQDFGLLTKAKGKWHACGYSTNTLDEMRDLYVSDLGFQLACQKAVLCMTLATPSCVAFHAKPTAPNPSAA
jgi:recombination protein RecA